ncbi:ATP-dependent zinc metalloprotease FtsH domain protein [Mycobacterium xenopi 4042]|uniref:ATP-dependent zinc metalloprotease FtsH domain protein n=1 Tax=Mycobacterium xenopi 4042 TaxID=1299334 RepID=X7ZY11_MYCXE|nr:ATP-dependent zinc metalloprotease FtsH domain protein [Mycobacterium xenopi 4042]
MDGFDPRAGVILIAATNRPTFSTPRCCGRPFRPPDSGDQPRPQRAQGNSASACQGQAHGPDADLDALAKRTVGMTGADLANVINEAALLTARENGTVITGAALEEAVDRVIGGRGARAG